MKEDEEEIDQLDDWIIDQSEETSHYIRRIVRNLVKSILTVKQLTCLDADSVSEAIALLRSQNGKVNCVLT